MKNIEKNLLSNEEILALVEKFHSGDGSALSALYSANEGLIKKIAGKYEKWSGLAMEDLIQEGTLGFIKAVEKFDPAKGTFSAYAGNYINWAILKAIREIGSPIKLPPDVHSMVLKVVKIQGELRKITENSYFNSTAFDEITAIAEEAAIPVDEAEYYLSLAEVIKLKSLDAPAGADNNRAISDIYKAAETDESIGDFIEAPEIEQPLDIAEFGGVQGIREVLSTLSPREAMLIDMRYGLSNGKPQTYEELARFFNVERERIIQVEAKALRKLRHPSRMKMWKK